MSGSAEVFRAGTRSSRLALWQTEQVIALFEGLFQGLENVDAVPPPRFQTLEITTPGDADRTTDLRESPADFFTRTLDEAVLNGTVDFAVHSAKDLPYPVADGLDWFWLPDCGDRRDALVGSLNPKTIGISSERRAAYCSTRFPTAEPRLIRGNIEERIAQVDDGSFDLIIMAGVALQRLGLEERIAEWIPLEKLDTPEAQGALAITFRKGDPRMIAIRNLFVKSAAFVGAGVTEGHCTLDGVRALQSADICLYDALMDDSLLKHLPETAQKIYVGKRQGAHSQPQDEINQILCDEVRKGKRVVRLKGGDAGIFGRLAEEVEALEECSLASRVIPGISAMQTAASGTGILLTRRGVARGFSVMTPRLQGGGLAPIDGAARAELPVVFFMSISVSAQLAEELIADGMPGDTPCAFVFEAGSDREMVLRGTLADLPEIPEIIRKLAGLFIVGEIARYGFEQTLGAFGGKRILLTCSEALMPQAVQAVHDFGGKPVIRPLIELVLNESALEKTDLGTFEWIALTSPSSVRCFHELLLKEKIDFRTVPKIMTVGSGTAGALEKIGLGCDLMPESDFSGQGLLEVAAPLVKGQKILRLRSQKAGENLAESLRAAGAEVADVVLYDNHFIHYDRCPEFDAVFFASASAVESFVEQWGAAVLDGKTILAIGGPTRAALAAAGVEATVTGKMATVDQSISDLARYFAQHAV
jgi:uroporphyrinogen III methyltransferase/synthase